ncbi:MAG TPA: multiple monosaccharide ABC transporter substrate-binding protein [Rectinemataceae bacterium]|nr:multiple monosaccharide ABC transporter substrate-binding protein [Rectinemataceae bacterium]
MNRFGKSVLLVLAICILAGGSLVAQAVKTVGIAMPTQSSARWIADGGNMKKVLEARGYKVDLQYAEDNIDAQVAQVENMITKGDSVLVIAAIDGAALFNVLEKAHAAKVPVISYDRLIVNSPWVSYYATFDNFKVGVLQGGYIVKALGLDKGQKGPFNIELFAGSPDDTNAGYFFNGAMSQLGPYIKSGVLVVKSGQTEFAKVATLRWDGAVAQKRMDDILTSKYTDAHVDAVLSPYDGLSIGILSALKSVGYGSAKKPLPVVTGQDAEIPSVKSILAGEQTSTVFKDTRTLAKRAADMVDSVLSGKPAEINDTKTYNNGHHIIPSYLCEPISVDKTNIKAALVDIGYYTAAQIGLK